MKKSKKLFSLLLSAAMALSLAACSDLLYLPGPKLHR